MFKIKISNYRNISRENPIELEIEKGTIFIVGRNNIGKSNILKFFYEFRSLFQHILVNFVSRHTNHELVNTIGTIQLQTIKDHYSLLDTFNQSN